MGRKLSEGAHAVVDLIALSVAFWLAFLLRFDWDISWPMFKRAVLLWPYVLTLKYGVMVALGVTRFAWRHVGLSEALRIGQAIVLCAVAFGLVRLGAGALLKVWIGFQYTALPFTVIVLDALLSFVATVGVRAARRLARERRSTVELRQCCADSWVATILIGAGSAGALIAKEIHARPDLRIRPVGFLDDDPVKLETVVHGLRVLGTTEALAQVCAVHDVKQALIAIANATRKDVRRITEVCRAQAIQVKIIPALYEIVGGRVNLSRIRDVEIEDLLGREPVVLEIDTLRAEHKARTALVTGAGGSIGSELCRQLCRFEVARLVLVERTENNLFHIHRELRTQWQDVQVVPCIADICDRNRMASVLESYAPDAVLHAAAHKHVPMMEWNPSEAIKNNVIGTQTVAELADEHGVSKFVMVSTDKAVNPTSIMGASKRVAELVIQSLSQKSSTRFVAVRFGNVLGSAGSVIPLFQEQIAKGGPVTVTDPEMRRYFMTIPEACQLVLQAAAIGGGGEILILDMGEPVRVVDLARDLIKLSGLQPGHDIEVVFTGRRPGEKLFEELSCVDEAASKTRHPKIFIGRIPPHDGEQVKQGLAKLVEAAEASRDRDIRAALRQLVPEYRCDAPTPG